jgi:hypothetical protein
MVIYHRILLSFCIWFLQDNVRGASDEGEGHQQDPARRSLAAGWVEQGDWPDRVEVTGRLGMGKRDDVQCESNRYHNPTSARLFEYTHDEKMSNYWIAGVDRAWFSKNDRKGETSKLCGMMTIMKHRSCL